MAPYTLPNVGSGVSSFGGLPYEQQQHARIAMHNKAMQPSAIK